jgi:hypothetical protein
MSLAFPEPDLLRDKLKLWETLRPRLGVGLAARTTRCVCNGVHVGGAAIEELGACSFLARSYTLR